MAANHEGQDSTNDTFKSFEDGLSNLLTPIHSLSNKLLELQRTSAVQGNSEAEVKFRDIAEKTRCDAIIYIKWVLPMITELMSFIMDFFEDYLTFTYEEWQAGLKRTCQRVRGYKDISCYLVELHQEILKVLMQRRDGAKEIRTEFVQKRDSMARQQEELEGTGKFKLFWGFAFFIIPFWGSHLRQEGMSDLEKAGAMGRESYMQGKCASAVTNGLIPILNRFVDNLENVARFFGFLSNRLQKFKQNGTEARRVDEEQERKEHYQRMRHRAKKINAICGRLVAALPVVRAEFSVIEKQEGDELHVQNFVQAQKKYIERKYTQNKIFDTVIESITGTDSDSDSD